jgi:hypothetical protein
MIYEIKRSNALRIEDGVIVPADLRVRIPNIAQVLGASKTQTLVLEQKSVVITNPKSGLKDLLVSEGATKRQLNMCKKFVENALHEIGFATDCGDLTDFIEILFVEPSGSGSVMLFESLDSIGANINQNEILINRNMQTLNNLRAEGGFSISSKSTRGTFSGTKQMSGEKKEISYFLSFASAGQYHIKLYDENESPYWAKFILTSCNFDYKGKTISMSGQLAMPILTSLNP